MAIGHAVQLAWRRARVKAGMPRVNFHDLRHSCAGIMLGLGVDLYTIGKIVGHAHIQTTQRYAYLQVDAQRDALINYRGWSSKSKLH